MNAPPSTGERVRAWLPAVLYMALIFAISSFRLELPSPSRVPHLDKLVHAIEYAILGRLCARASQRSFPDRSPIRAALVGLLVACAWGLADELHQAFVPGRTADLRDVAADAAGATVGALTALRTRRRSAAAS